MGTVLWHFFLLILTFYPDTDKSLPLLSIIENQEEIYENIENQHLKKILQDRLLAKIWLHLENKLQRSISKYVQDCFEDPRVV